MWLLFEAEVITTMMMGTRSPLLPKPFLFQWRIRDRGPSFSTRTSSASSSSAAGDDQGASAASPYEILGVDPTTTPCSPAQLKAAFRARVKEFHPDVCKDNVDAGAIIQRVIQAYEILSKRHDLEDTEGACLDPFDEPECEAYDLFINEVLCLGKGCPYSCVKRAPYAFSFTAENGTARATSQGHNDDYQVQLAVGQCPKRCIHYVTPSQRAVLEDLLDSILNDPYNMGDAALMESLISKAIFENNRYQEPKRRPKASTEYVDWC
ncbi:uncharacterized protein A4U43_C07F17900 [Asparagus officinalis]|uniref:J domain-containing protein n=1 Tax=Asparagus officinalis TaxID=4686 RepID=A0A5P1ECX3_ASPOF|nr:uncharacterized protein LOC109850802 [Asparagus officinalis]ONK63692.1 uncharacterized protein A4U43_C07F17900 [Asparagus officinalis]